MRVGKRVVQDGPEEDIETEGERYLHSLAKKQMMTDITLKKQFSQHRQFSTTSAFKPHVDTLVGVVQLKDYQKTDHLDARIEELSRYGLTNNEIQLKIKHETGKLSEMRSGVLINPDIEKEQLTIIDAKISEKKSADSFPVQFSDVQKVTRHEMDLEKAICSTKDGKLSKHLVVQKDYEKSNPLSMVPDLMTEMEDKINSKFRERRRERKRNKKYGESVDKMKAEISSELKEGNSLATEECQEYKGPYGEWELVLPPPKDKNIVLGPLPLGTSRSIKTTHVIEQIPEKEILDNRLTCEEIKQIPKFENYHKGVANNVLYIKNIDNKVTEEDLISVFGRFRQDDQPSIQYKLMTGRMRGQAFITFHDTPTAATALEMINGYKLKDKHLIIQYGKPSNK
ncbi:hypothetical protein LOTGIDRAFT_104984 [Lottia gigantea]|uniref:RRM domain-containing protein n=1 Tax=Lottia gigantea TaxID=225164 RepID=V4AB40_LOTGI|nr:hypothetical protein LOTGIDRAFT_104984 [Lottia gigantea]ESO94007.1 hypothetical protein LOTGIDRAFT_104984 [Lottia gigantea]